MLSIASLSDTPDPLVQGTPVTLTANDVTGRLVRVYFYRETNGEAGLQSDTATPDLLVGSDLSSTGGYTVSVPTDGLSPGPYTYYAQGESLFGSGENLEWVLTNVVETVNTVVRPNSPPTIGGLVLSPGSTFPPPDFIHVTPIGVADPDGASDIAAVFYYFNGRSVGSTYGGDFSFDLAPGSLPVGTGELSAKALDHAGAESPLVTAPITVLNDPPRITKFVASTPNLYNQPIHFQVEVLDANRDAFVSLYRESNGTPGLQAEAGGDVKLIGAYTPLLEQYDTVPPGAYTYYATATDRSGASDFQSAAAFVLPNRPPMIDHLAGETGGNPLQPLPVTVEPDQGVKLTAVDARDPDASAVQVAFYMEGNGLPGLQVGSDARVSDFGPPTYSFRVGLSGRSTVYAVTRDASGLMSEPASGEVVVRNRRPALGSLSAAPARVAADGTVTLTASNIFDLNGAADVHAVAFYRESNGVPGFQVGGDAGLGLDTTPADGFSLAVPAASLPGGTNQFYATAVDSGGEVSEPATAAAEVEAAPTIASLTDTPDPVAPGGTLTLTAAGVADFNRDAVTVWFYRESDGTAGFQPTDELLGPAGSTSNYSLSFAAPSPAVRTTYTYYAVADDGHSRGNVVSTQNTVGTGPEPATVVGRRLLYNNSAFDGNSPAANAADDAAIPEDKQGALPGEPLGPANVSTFTRGINGIVLDVRNLPADPEGYEALGLNQEDFQFRAGSAGSPSSWLLAPPATSVTVRRGAGAGGSDRVTVLFADAAIRNTWLEVEVLADGHTGLAVPDVFYFGSLVGDTGDSATAFRVNALDLGAVKKALNGTAGITSRVDFNRDGRINALDLGAAKLNLNRSLAAPAISLAASVATAALEPSPAPAAGLFSTTRVRDDATADVLGLTT